MSAHPGALAPAYHSLSVPPPQPATLAVGDHVLYFFDEDPRGFPATVVGAYDLYEVPADGATTLRPGYAIQFSTKRRANPVFAPAHRLTREDGQITHLRLANSTKPAAPAVQGATA